MPDTSPLLSLIIVTHNSASWLRTFAQSWENIRQESPSLAAEKTQMVFADSGSTDDTARVIEELFPHALIVSCRNIGFGAAANAAFKQVHTPWILLCNPDLTFLPGFGANFLNPIVSPNPGSLSGADIERGGCFAPRLMNPNGTQQPSVGRFPTIPGILCDQLHKPEMRKYQVPQPIANAQVDWATGACLLIRLAAFESVGGFDEKYFLYTEEVDFLRRLADAGHKTFFIPAGSITHHAPNAARKPRNEALLWSARGLLRYFAKFSPASLLAYRWLAFLAGRLPAREAFASRAAILERPTGP